MTHTLLLPELAESVVEGEILKWLIAEGERVEKDQPLVEVMTDKVTVELPSSVSGVLTRQLVREGDLVPVHAPIALIDPASAGELSAPLPSADRLAPGAGDDQSLFRAFGDPEVVRLPPRLGAAAVTSVPPPVSAVAPIATDSPSPRQRAVPSARRLARSLGIDLAQVAGSGPNGRIRPADVHWHQGAQTGPEQTGPEQTGPEQADREQASPEQTTRPAAAPVSGSGLPVAPVQYRTPAGYEALETRVPLRGLRRAISNQLLASHLYTVRTLTVDEANLSRLVELRGRLNEQLAAGQPGTGQSGAGGVKLSYLPFIFKATAAALRQFPSLNTSFDEARQEIVQKGYYNLGLAVSSDAGLIVPVVRDVDRKSVLELAREIADLAARARGGQLRPEETSGSSFSVTNIGTIGALFSFPIINVPDAAILGVHSIVRRPICNEAGDIVAAQMMYLSLSFDHRLVDGADAARFCKAVIRSLENPELLLIGAV